MSRVPNPPKHFAQIVRINGFGNASAAIILTPPLDTAEQAQQYADWFNGEKNQLRHTVISTMRGRIANDTFVVRTFETTLY